ncbi:PepSY domain-containing protein [Gordonia sp. PP30]|uniref:PepSY-associated TM helix domain-containing protein n=1 Tax=Gordonia sp. PP30 TaxID=2935861 RepID=UPI001FFF6049|nr:PepSY domain-containing protein [Gordonia sp. PP30]UQE76045.1 PepSY domain-containing protein [Gordonia sp. PP30]
MAKSAEPLTPTETPGSPAVATDPGPPRPRAASITHLLRRLHFYAGVIVGPFLLIAAISGGLYALAPSAEQLIYRAQLHTDSTGEAHSIAEQVDAARAQRPDLTVSAVRPPASPGDTTQVLFADPSLPESTRLAVFVDPVTLRVQGELPSYGSSGSLPVRTWLDGLHRNLHLGEPGRMYSEFAASWLWVIALAGLALWVVNVRKQRRTRGTGRLLTLDRSARGRARSMNWHAVVGIWIILALLFLSATGLTWSRFAGENVSELRSTLSWTQPSVDTSLGNSPSADDGMADMPGMGHGHGGSAPAATGSAAVAATNAGYVDTALALARSVGVGRSDAVEISIPSDDDTAFTVAEVRAPWQFSPDTAAVDPSRDRVVAVDRFAHWPLAAKLANLGIALHMGILFGLLNQLVLFVVAVALVFLIVWGYRMWWQRRPRGAHRPGRAPTRGALRELPWPAIGVLAAIAAAVGWFIPLLGWPLLAFLVIDVVFGLAQRVRPDA